jgi:solute carrier family 50 protein (sugar transporter)
MNTLDIIAYIATVLTILSFLSGLSICLNIYRKGSTNEFSAFPFIAGVLCTTLWLRYGFILNDMTMIFVNSVGVVLQSLYLIWFYAFTLKRETLTKQIVLLLAFLVMAYIIGQSREDPKTLAGTLACISSLVFCGSPLASVSDVIKTKSTEKLPFLLILSSFLVTIMWFLYGFALNDAFIQVPNAIGALISGVQLYLFVIYPNEPKSRKD